LSGGGPERRTRRSGEQQTGSTRRFGQTGTESPEARSPAHLKHPPVQHQRIFADFARKPDQNIHWVTGDNRKIRRRQTGCGTLKLRASPIGLLFLFLPDIVEETLSGPF